MTRVVEAVLGYERLGADPLEGVRDVLGGDRAADRRAEHDAVLQRERIRQAVVRDFAASRWRGRERARSRRAGHVLVAHEVAEQQVRVEAEAVPRYSPVGSKPPGELEGRLPARSRGTQRRPAVSSRPRVVPRPRCSQRRRPARATVQIVDVPLPVQCRQIRQSSHALSSFAVWRHGGGPEDSRMPPEVRSALRVTTTRSRQRSAARVERVAEAVAEQVERERRQRQEEARGKA